MLAKRITASAASFALLFGVASTTSIASANAAVTPVQLKSDCIDTLNIETWDGSGFYVAGVLDWNADPNPCYSKGDSFRICDEAGDGWGIEAFLQGSTRSSSTQGHSSPYCPNWSNGDLVEGHDYKFDIFLVKGDTTSFIETLTVHN